jgi:hypothetical protein
MYEHFIFFYILLQFTCICSYRRIYKNFKIVPMACFKGRLVLMDLLLFALTPSNGCTTSANLAKPFPDLPPPFCRPPVRRGHGTDGAFPSSSRRCSFFVPFRELSAARSSLLRMHHVGSSTGGRNQRYRAFDATPLSCLLKCPASTC